MTIQTLTLNVPDTLYARLGERARQANRSIEAEAIDALAAAVPAEETLPADLAETLDHLAALDDAALWQAARSRLAEETAAQLEHLHDKRQRQGLTEAETRTLAGLVREYERAMLLRARAAALLKQRGHDVASLLASP